MPVRLEGGLENLERPVPVVATPFDDFCHCEIRSFPRALER